MPLCFFTSLFSLSCVYAIRPCCVMFVLVLWKGDHSNDLSNAHKEFELRCIIVSHPHIRFTSSSIGSVRHTKNSYMLTRASLASVMMMMIMMMVGKQCEQPMSFDQMHSHGIIKKGTKNFHYAIVRIRKRGARRLSERARMRTAQKKVNAMACINSWWRKWFVL